MLDDSNSSAAASIDALFLHDKYYIFTINAPSPWSENSETNGVSGF